LIPFGTSVIDSASKRAHQGLVNAIERIDFASSA